MQELIVAVVVAACLAYTARRLWLRFRAASGGDVRCAGCPLADTCQHKHDTQPAHAECPHHDGVCSCCH